MLEENWDHLRIIMGLSKNVSSARCQEPFSCQPPLNTLKDLYSQFRASKMMFLASVVVILRISAGVLGAFSQTRPQVPRPQPSLADQDDFVKHPQKQKPLEPEELKV